VELENPRADLEAARGRIEKLKYELREAKGRSRAQIAKLRTRRDASRPKLAAQVKRKRAQWRARINARIAEIRALHGDVWRARIARARGPVLQKQAELVTERGYQADERRERAAERTRKRTPAARRVARAAKAESDFEVEGNIDPDLVPVWHRVKNRIRTAGTRATRTEAFLEWVGENRGEVNRLLSDVAAEAQDELEDELAAQEAAHYEERAA
jgi:hypothetical protein